MQYTCNQSVYIVYLCIINKYLFIIMKEKILDGLKTKYNNLGFSDKAFDGVADFLQKTITKEDELDNAISGVEPLLKAMQGETDRERGKRSELEKKLKELTKPKEVEPIKQPKDEGVNELEAMKQYFEEKFGKVSQKLEAYEAAKLKEAREKEFFQKAQAKGIKKELLGLVTIPKDGDIDEFVGNVAQTLVNAGIPIGEPDKGKGKPQNELNGIAELINKKTEELKK